MKKGLCILLALILCLSAASAALADDATLFTPTLTSVLNYDAETWFSDGLNRALVTLMLYMDYLTATGEEASTYSIIDSTVGLSSDVLCVILANPDTGTVLSLLCNPAAQTASYLVGPGTLSAVKEGLTNSDTLNAPITFQDNTVDDLSGALEILQEAFGSN